MERLKSEETTKREFMMLNQTIMINEVRTKIMEKAQMMQDDIRQTKNKIEKNNADIKKLETEVADFKLKKMVYRFKLKELYVSLMQNPEDLL